MREAKNVSAPHRKASPQCNLALAQTSSHFGIEASVICVVEAARKYDRVVQVGTQNAVFAFVKIFRYTPLQNCRVVRHIRLDRLGSGQPRQRDAYGTSRAA